MSFHLRPVTDLDSPPSSSSSTSTATAADRSPIHIPSRRPLSPSSLRDLNLTQDATPATSRKFPAPPTGHELMALFPPAPPASFPEMRPGPTSGFFQRQERAFFAQAGKEIVRVRVEIDVPPDDGVKNREGGARTWPIEPSSPLKARQSRATQSPGIYPGSPHGQPPLNLHTPGGTTLHEGHSGTTKEFQAEDYRDEGDETWRRPTPYADRRRAGKHTRRVIVRT